MARRNAKVLLNVWAVLLGVMACNDSITGPKTKASFAIGNGGSFVTTGGAEITFIVDLFTDRWSFNAKGDPASGEFNWQGKVFGVNTHIHGDVICYSISANKARVGGVIDNSDVPSLMGQEAMWMVEDNGEGSGALARDRVTPISIAPVPGTAAAYCTAPAGVPDPDMFPTETGNVQVHF
jgi:hypothetical protein